jgi:5'(3')-deoxyribonucleotidase
MIERGIFPDTIYLDGVFADFWGFVKTQIQDADILPNKEVWRRLGTIDHLFLKPHVIENAIPMLDVLYNKYGDRIEFLTACPKYEIFQNVELDKRTWLCENIPYNIPVNVVRDKKQKALFCRSSKDILIDDYIKNIMDWNAVGGIGILHHSPEETLGCLRERGFL